MQRISIATPRAQITSANIKQLFIFLQKRPHRRLDTPGRYVTVMPMSVICLPRPLPKFFFSARHGHRYLTTYINALIVTIHRYHGPTRVSGVDCRPLSRCISNGDIVHRRPTGLNRTAAMCNKEKNNYYGRFHLCLFVFTRSMMTD